MSVKWYGDEIERKIEEATKVALTAASIQVQGDARKRCPVKLGRLRNSINYRVLKDEAIIGTSVFYAPYIEFGTGIYAEGGGRRTPWIYFDEIEGQFFRTRGSKPHPFMRPAIDENRQEVNDIFQREFKRVLND